MAAGDSIKNTSFNLPTEANKNQHFATMGAEYSETLNDRDIGGQLLPLDSLGNSNTNNQVGE